MLCFIEFGRKNRKNKFLKTDKLQCWSISILCWPFRFRLTAPAKSVHWGVQWDVPDDSMLLVGIFEYGLGSWEAIKADQSLELSSKVKELLQWSRFRYLRVGMRKWRLKKVLNFSILYSILWTKECPPVRSANHGLGTKSQDEVNIGFTALSFVRIFLLLKPILLWLFFPLKDPPPWDFEATRQTSADKSGIPD